jgi:RecJ-like exonuclease
MKIKCGVCHGEGWYADHSPNHYANSHDDDCSQYGCPVQVECENCKATGYIDKDEMQKQINANKS